MIIALIFHLHSSIIISYICLLVKYIWRFNLDRHACITSKMLKELKKIFTGLLNDKSCDILEFGGENDHVHILFEAPPQVQLSKIVNTLKTVSSRLIKKKYDKHLKKYYRKKYYRKSALFGLEVTVLYLLVVLLLT